MTVKNYALASGRLSSFLSVVYTRLLGFNLVRRKGKKNAVSLSDSFVQKTRVVIVGDGNMLVFGKRCHIKNCRFFLSGNNNQIVLHEHVTAEGCAVHVEDDGNRIDIGRDTVLNTRTHLACIEGTNLCIGSDCLLSSEVVLRTGDSHALLNLTGERINESSDISISSHVWIGHRAMLLKGSGIGSDSVVAAGAIVTRRFSESNVVLGGIPARVLKRNITWDTERV